MCFSIYSCGITWANPLLLSPILETVYKQSHTDVASSSVEWFYSIMLNMATDRQDGQIGAKWEKMRNFSGSSS